MLYTLLVILKYLVVCSLVHENISNADLQHSDLNHVKPTVVGNGITLMNMKTVLSFKSWDLKSEGRKIGNENTLGAKRA